MIRMELDPEDLKRLKQKLGRINPENRGPVFVRMLRDGGSVVQKRLTLNVSNKILKRRTGRLAQSISSRVVLNELKAEVGSGVLTGKRVKYADIHERGGLIRPKRSRYLTIPTKIALTPAGVLKRTKARDFPNTFVMKRGNLLGIWQKHGRSIRLLFVLKKQVRIPARRYAAKTSKQIERRARDIMEAILNREIRSQF